MTNRRASATHGTGLPATATLHRAVQSRAASWDGRFVYGVITTGIYCRPSCPTRAARPENLRFFAGPEDAHTAGFRACRRCRPDEACSQAERLAETARYIEAHAEEQLTLALLAKRAGLSPSRFQRAFKALFGVSPRVYQDGVRQRRFRDALRRGSEVTAAIHEVGYGSTSRLYGEAARNVGMTPRAYRAGGAGEHIRWACRSTRLGPLLVAATQKGVCFAQFGDGKAALLAQLKAEFPAAELAPAPTTGEAALDDWMRALDAWLDARGPRPDVPLDLRGTAFQLLVWRFLLGLEDGAVVSYSEVARGIGKPKAVRAAASACGANRVAVLVPCHRVLRGDGGLGGYRWGVERKRALLDGERRQAGQERERAQRK